MIVRKQISLKIVGTDPDERFITIWSPWGWGTNCKFSSGKQYYITSNSTGCHTVKNEQSRTKPTKLPLHTGKTQISLGIHKSYQVALASAKTDQSLPCLLEESLVVVF